MVFQKLSRADLLKQREELQKRYDTYAARKLNLDMTRGKPCPEQLDLSNALTAILTDKDFSASDGTDCRNYGGLDGLPEAKKLFAEYLEVAPDEIIIGGNSSLTLITDVLYQAMISGLSGSPVPWGKLPKVKFLCPSPGYDRHFAILEYLNIEMVTIELKDDGPDMDAVEKLAAEDGSIKGIFCVPKYSNPTGITYSDAVVDRLAKMKTTAPDFTIMWDNAYTAHHLSNTPDRLKNLLAACKETGNPERVLILSSTSKLTLAGAGIAMIGGSKKNMDVLRKRLSIQTIGPDKMNQLRHCRFFKSMADIEAHMKKHAVIIKPKFDAALEVLEKELGGKNIASWTKPNGGYFISVDSPDNCAKAVINLSANAGVKLTPAGSTYPYKKDPKDRNIRIAPTFPSSDDIHTATEIFCVALQITAIDRLLGK